MLFVCFFVFFCTWFIWKFYDFLRQGLCLMWTLRLPASDSEMLGLWACTSRSCFILLFKGPYFTDRKFRISPFCWLQEVFLNEWISKIEKKEKWDIYKPTKDLERPQAQTWQGLTHFAYDLTSVSPSLSTSPDFQSSNSFALLCASEQNSSPLNLWVMLVI